LDPATACRWLGNCSEQYGASHYLDILLLASRDPGDYFCFAGKRESSSR
jgi:hypothetical protein